MERNKQEHEEKMTQAPGEESMDESVTKQVYDSYREGTIDQAIPENKK